MSEDSRSHSLALSVYNSLVEPFGGGLRMSGLRVTKQVCLVNGYDSRQAGCARVAAEGATRDSGSRGRRARRSKGEKPSRGCPAMRVNDWWRRVAGSF